MQSQNQKTGLHLKKWISRFAGDESGVITIEAILWFPLFFFLLLLVAEGSMVFNKQTLAMRIVQDVNRYTAVGGFENATTAEDALRVRIEAISPNATVQTEIKDGLAVSLVQMPVRDLSGFGFFGKNTNFNVSVTSQQLVER